MVKFQIFCGRGQISVGCIGVRLNGFQLVRIHRSAVLCSRANAALYRCHAPCWIIFIPRGTYIPHRTVLHGCHFTQTVISVIDNLSILEQLHGIVRFIVFPWCKNGKIPCNICHRCSAAKIIIGKCGGGLAAGLCCNAIQRIIRIALPCGQAARPAFDLCHAAVLIIRIRFD